MKKLKNLLIIFICIFSDLNAQIVLNEGFESGTFNSLITFQSVGTFTSNPGIKENTNFGSNKAFGFGKSVCGSSCFDNYKTTLTITFPTPTFVDSITWNEMEISGNWGSQGVVLIDGNILSGSTLGALPVNSGTAETSPRKIAYSINQTATTIKIEVTDITSVSEILIDDLKIKTKAKMAGYEYWFNYDYTNKTRILGTLNQQLQLNLNVSTSGLETGVNSFNFRSFDNLGKYSNTLSHLFYKLPESYFASNNIIAYEYWLNNDYANAIVINTPVQTQISLTELLNMQTLQTGVQALNIRFKDSKNLWSNTMSHLFYKVPEQNIIGQNKIISYRYWFNDEFNQAVNVTMPTPSSSLVLATNIDLPQIQVGLHTIHFQFQDELGMWSVITTDSIEKISDVNIVENTFKSNILAYPNPTNGKIFIDFGEVLNDIKLSIHTIDGKLVQQYVYKNKQSLELNINDPAGVYLMTISSENKKATIRFTKN